MAMMQPIYNQCGDLIGWVMPDQLLVYGPMPSMRKGMVLEVTSVDEKTTVFRVLHNPQEQE
jgi:hypothetical protein